MKFFLKIKNYLNNRKLFKNNIKRYKNFLKTNTGYNHKDILSVLHISLNYMLEQIQQRHNTETLKEYNIKKAILYLDRLLNSNIRYVEEYNLLLNNEEFKSKDISIAEYVKECYNSDWNALWFLLKGTRTKGTGLNNWDI